MRLEAGRVASPGAAGDVDDCWDCQRRREDAVFVVCAAPASEYRVGDGPFEFHTCSHMRYHEDLCGASARMKIKASARSGLEPALG